MAHKKAPLSGRDLIRYLPDLLTGKEPVFDDPAVQRFITQDPEGRAAVGLIADTAAALTVAHDRVATQTYAAIKPLRESVLAAKKYAKRQLADLLFYEGTRRWHDALNRMGEICSFDYLVVPERGRSDVDDALVAYSTVVDELGYAPRKLTAGVSALGQTSSGASPNSLVRSAHSLFVADVGLIPGRDGSSFMSLASSVPNNRIIPPKKWLERAKTYTEPVTIACALDHAMTYYMESGSYSAAADLARELVNLAPDEPILQVHVLITGLATTNLMLVRKSTDALLRLNSTAPQAWDVTLKVVALEAGLLELVDKATAKRMRALVKDLPGNLAVLVGRSIA